MKKLPKILYAKKVKNGDVEYFEASEEKIELLDDMTSWTTIGEYHLKKVSKIKGTIIEQ